METLVNPLGPRQNGRQFANDTFKCIFLNGNIWTVIEISLKYVTLGRIDNKPALVQIIQLGTEQATSHYLKQWWPSLLTYICVTWPQWVKIVTHLSRHKSPSLFVICVVNIYWLIIQCVIHLMLLIISWWVGPGRKHCITHRNTIPTRSWVSMVTSHQSLLLRSITNLLWLDNTQSYPFKMPWRSLLAWSIYSNYGFGSGL